MQCVIDSNHSIRLLCTFYHQISDAVADSRLNSVFSDEERKWNKMK